LALVTLFVLLVFIITAFVKKNVFSYHCPLWIIFPIDAWTALAAASFLTIKMRDNWAFTLSALTVGGLAGSNLIAMIPRIMGSTLGEPYDFTIHNAFSGAYTLKVMSYFSLALLPFVLGYQTWSYVVFRKRLKKDDRVGYC